MSRDSERFNELFSDGWRDPTDDVERLANYLVFVLGMAFGYTLLGLSVFHPETFSDNRPGLQHVPIPWGVLLFFGVFGSLIGGASTWFLAKESTKWDKKLTLEKLVSGGFTLGFAVMMLGFLFLGHYRGEASPQSGITLLSIILGCIGLGLAICLISLIVGLICAYAPMLVPARRFRRAVIEERYALDDKLEVVEGHPCPWEDGMIPVVAFRTAKGKVIKTKAKPSCYELAEPGLRVDLSIKEGKLVALRPAS